MKRLVRNANENDDFIQNWFYNYSSVRQNEKLMQQLFQQYRYSGIGYRGLIIDIPDFQGDFPAEFQELAELPSNNKWQMFGVDNVRDEDKFTSDEIKHLNQLFENYALWVIDNYPSKKWESWSKSITGVQYYNERANISYDDPFHASKKDINLIITSKIEGIDLTELIDNNHLTSSEANSIKNAEEIIASKVGKILIYQIEPLIKA